MGKRLKLIRVALYEHARSHPDKWRGADTKLIWRLSKQELLRRLVEAMKGSKR